MKTRHRLRRLAQIILILGSFVLLSCHKYSEDPFISFRRPIVRLCGGWQFTSYQINGVEHIQDFDNFLAPYTLADLVIGFDYGVEQMADNYTISFEGYGGGYNLSTDYKTIEFFGQGDGIPSDSTKVKFSHNVFKAQIIYPYVTNSTTWTIVELYGKHFHISNNGVDIYFKRIH